MSDTGIPRDARLQTGKDPGFLKSTDGIFKGVQLVLVSLLAIFLWASHYWSLSGAGFVAFANFAATFNLITLIISFIIYYFKFYNGCCLDRLPWRNVELYYALVSAVMHLIGMVLSSITAAQFVRNGLFIASAVFAVLVSAAFVAYAFLIFRGHDPRSVQSPVDSV